MQANSFDFFHIYFFQIISISLIIVKFHCLRNYLFLFCFKKIRFLLQTGQFNRCFFFTYFSLTCFFLIIIFFPLTYLLPHCHVFCFLVILTGSTGFYGAFLLHALLKSPEYAHCSVICVGVRVAGNIHPQAHTHIHTHSLIHMHTHTHAHTHTHT